MSLGPVYWHQGLFLQPQHFQTADLRVMETLSQLAGAIRPWFWGVRHLTLDAGALAAGSIGLQRLTVLFPQCGEQFQLPGNAVCAARVLPDGMDVGDTLLVWLGLPLLKPGQSNVTVCDNAEELNRASTALAVITGQEPVEDLYQLAPAAHVRRLSHVLRLVFDHEVAEQTDMTLMPLVRVVRTGQGFEEDASYTPPVLAIGESSLLTGIMQEVRDRVLGKTRQLDSYKGLSQRGNMGEMASLFMVLRSLSRFAARLDVMCAAPHTPPWDAYSLLRELLAELSVFSREYNPLGEDASGKSVLVPYRHEDAAPAFKTLSDCIAHLLSGLSTGPRFMVRFEPSPPFWRARCAPHVLDNSSGRNEFWITLTSASTRLSDLGASLNMIKLASGADLPTLLARAIPGVPYTVEASPPPGMSLQPGTAYLRLHHESPLWEAARTHGGLELSWDDAPSDMLAHLVVMEGA